MFPVSIPTEDNLKLLASILVTKYSELLDNPPTTVSDVVYLTISPDSYPCSEIKILLDAVLIPEDWVVTSLLA